MTQAEYARHRNKSPRYIGKPYKAGVLVMRSRLVDVAASDAVLDDKPSARPERVVDASHSFASGRERSRTGFQGALPRAHQPCVFEPAGRVPAGLEPDPTGAFRK